MFTYYVLSVCGEDGRFACEIHKTAKYVSDPDKVVIPAKHPDRNNVMKLFLQKAAYISDDVCKNSITRQTQWRQSLGIDVGDRLRVNFGRYSVLKYLTSIIDPDDRIILCHATYTAGIVRGSMLPIDDYENDLIELCYQYNVYFTENDLGSELDHKQIWKRVNSIPLSTKCISETDMTGWLREM